MKSTHEITLTTDHFQVLFGDSVQAPLVDTTALWEPPGRVIVSSELSELIGLGTVRYGGTTRLRVDIAEAPPDVPPDWQPMGCFDLNIPSGQLIFWGPELADISKAASLRLRPGHYQGAAFSRDTEAVVDEMDPDGPDEYLLILWKG